MDISFTFAFCFFFFFFGILLYILIYKKEYKNEKKKKKEESNLVFYQKINISQIPDHLLQCIIRGLLAFIYRWLESFFFINFYCFLYG